MAITKEKKVEILKQLAEIVKLPTLVFVNFRGLSVAGATALRAKLRDKEIGYFVAKKTLLARALSETKISGSLPELEGEIAVVYGHDPLAGTKGVNDFAKAGGQVKIAGGVYEGSYADSAFMTVLAEIPSREVLLGQLVNLINSPIQGLVMALSEIAKKRGA